ncbi:hypothetical protein ACFL28_01135 [Candidatus Omnitrophota bacterium]
MEKAIHITKLKNLRYWKPVYERLYWGSEFCENLISGIKEAKKALEFTLNKGLDFTLVTPFVTEEGLKKLEGIFKWLKANRISCEIAVNDWGVLKRLHSHYNGFFELALGRLLTRQDTNPSIRKIIEKQLPTAIKNKDGKIAIFVHRVPGKCYQSGIRASYINSKSVQDFLSQLGIKRIELNNTVQGLNTEGVYFKKSLHVPYVNISTTRFCPMETKTQKIYRINVCKRECQRMYDKLRNRSISKVIYKRGNTTFYKNPVLPKKIYDLGIDRIVYQCEIPF